MYFSHFILHFRCILKVKFTLLKFTLLKPTGANGGSRRRQEGFFLLEARLPEGASGVANRLGFGIAKIKVATANHRSTVGPTAISDLANASPHTVAAEEV
mmetsp:Transcript_20057/g.41319  ORF Transcript_20057/g.41319 Transcript_20057/m.41319 type:complete len:100 (+) Transcript_20057:2601-2900(+)